MGTANTIPMVSIIIPAYQAQDFIEDCVKSVCAQKWSDFVIANSTEYSEIMEIILVDDGSTDSTGEICDNLKECISFLKVLHVKNGGVSKARNLGMENSCGRYIAFVDADDLVSENYISDLLEAAIKSSARMVIMDGKIVSNELITGHRYIEDGILSEDTHVWGKLFERELLQEDKRVLFPEGITIGEDMLFLLDVLIRISDENCISLIEGGGYKYNFNDNGAMLTEFKASYLDQIKCWNMAEERMNAMDNKLSDNAEIKFAVIRIMATLLVVSKFAKYLNMRENIDKAVTGAMKKTVIDLAEKEIKRATKRSGVYGKLSTGYKIKVAIFSISPELYIKLYGQWKKR